MNKKNGVFVCQSIEYAASYSIYSPSKAKSKMTGKNVELKGMKK